MPNRRLISSSAVARYAGRTREQRLEQLGVAAARDEPIEEGLQNGGSRSLLRRKSSQDDVVGDVEEHGSAAAAQPVRSLPVVQWKSAGRCSTPSRSPRRAVRSRPARSAG